VDLAGVCHGPQKSNCPKGLAWVAGGVGGGVRVGAGAGEGGLAAGGTPSLIHQQHLLTLRRGAGILFFFSPPRDEIRAGEPSLSFYSSIGGDDMLESGSDTAGNRVGFLKRRRQHKEHPVNLSLEASPWGGLDDDSFLSIPVDGAKEKDAVAEESASSAEVEGREKVLTSEKGEEEEGGGEKAEAGKVDKLWVNFGVCFAAEIVAVILCVVFNIIIRPRVCAAPEEDEEEEKLMNEEEQLGGKKPGIKKESDGKEEYEELEDEEEREDIEAKEYPSLVSKLAAEFLGVFFLVLAISAKVTAAPGGGPHDIGIPVTLAIVVYSFGDVSGGHINPAVSLGLLGRGLVTPVEMVLYWGPQIAGALMGGLVFGGAIGSVMSAPASPPILPLPPDGFRGSLASCVKEVLATMVFLLTICTVATTTSTSELVNKGLQPAPVSKLSEFFGLIIGLYVCVAITIWGASLNPAATIGLDISFLVLGKRHFFSALTKSPLQKTFPMAKRRHFFCVFVLRQIPRSFVLIVRNGREVMSRPESPFV